MGQRSQIYVKVDNKLEIANYYQWNYGTRMISRAKYGIEWIQKNINYPYTLKRNGYEFEKFRRIWDVNFDYKDIIISSDIFKDWEYDKQYFENFNKYCYLQQDNNDGKLFIAVDTNNQTIKFTFTDCDLNILSPDQYMDWDCEGWRKKDFGYIDAKEKQQCYKNIRDINSMAEQMSQEELLNFIETTSIEELWDNDVK